MIRKLLVLSLGLMVFLAPAASAGTYNPPSINAELLGNGLVRITGTGCQPNEPVSIQYNPTVNSTADSNGSFSVTIDVKGLTGDVVVTATCGDLVQSLTLALGSGSTGPLPRTGDDSSLPLARMGAILVAFGGAALYLSQRRSKSSISATA